MFLLHIASYPHIPCIWLGDFNCPWDRSLDHFNSPSVKMPSPSSLQHSFLTSTLQITVEHCRHYSYLTPQFGTLSAEYLSRALSREFLTTLQANNASGSQTNPLELNGVSNLYELKILPQTLYFMNKWQTFFTDNEGTAQCGVVWDSFKAHVRGVMTLAIYALKRGFAHNCNLLMMLLRQN